MSTREKIIVGIMIVAVVAGGIHFLLPSGERGTAARAPDFTAVITQVQAGAQAGRLTNREQLMLKRATEPWSRDPFITRLPTTPDLAETDAAENDFRLPMFTGFLSIGERALAIIDGREYRQNDWLRGREFRVAAIHPERVELIREGASSPLSIPLTEEPEHEEP